MARTASTVHGTFVPREQSPRLVALTRADVGCSLTAQTAGGWADEDSYNPP